MSKPIEVTERDLRMPEFRDADPSELEFRSDGKIVRKDRWERGIRQIAAILCLDGMEGFEIEDLVEEVRKLDKVTDANEGCSVTATDAIRDLELALLMNLKVGATCATIAKRLYEKGYRKSALSTID